MNPQQREVGRSGLRVGALGLGCATLGGSRHPVRRDEAEALLRHAWEAGIRYIDVAPFYGYGAAERRVGDALRHEQRSDWVLSTKVGRLLVPEANPEAGPNGTPRPMPFGAVYDYSYDGVMRSFEHSLQRLGLDRIDILLVHDIGEYVHGAANEKHLRDLREGGARALAELKQSGAIRAAGLGVFEPQVCLDAMDWGRWDLFLLGGAYTLLDQGPLQDLLPACQRHGVSIVVGSPFNAGVLVGGELWNYKPVPPAVRDKVAALRDLCHEHGVPIAAATLQFPLAHPSVAAVIPGPRSIEELDLALSAARHRIPDALWAALKQRGLIHPDAPTPDTPPTL
ncbi:MULTISPECIES: aldo/keto reductase [unclassified Variovorax]|uniref:aldo/keto reductase n=1 Tax=unclassified Variovorax TaxID=663243 RepID=UPI002579067A|nr:MULTISPECIES: aldo/keto reductase [unclassified Variovorax]MDM0090007.1 aldo/keto reductase [Variovorax sp. J22G40]MDM0148327.1 aldo/keto reductase [Variovorax sp. J2P1-31]